MTQQRCRTIYMFAIRTCLLRILVNTQKRGDHQVPRSMRKHHMGNQRGTTHNPSWARRCLAWGVRGFSKTHNSTWNSFTNFVRGTFSDFSVNCRKRSPKYTCRSVGTPSNRWTRTYWSTTSRKFRYRRRFCGLIWIYSRLPVEKVSISSIRPYSNRLINCRKTLWGI